MMPVDDGNTSAASRFRSRAVSEHTLLQFRMPAWPVAQFAFPEFTIAACTRPLLFARAERPTPTGAAVTRLRVNSAAAEVLGSAIMSARSGFPLALIPAFTDANLNPLGRKTGSGRIIPAVSPESLQAPVGSQTWALRL